MDPHESKSSFMQIFRRYGSIENYCAETARRQAEFQSHPYEVDDNGRLEDSGGERESQTAEVLQMLRRTRAANRWVEIAEFLDAGISNYRGCIAALRHRGFGIANWVQRDRPGRVESWYLLTFDQERDEQ